MNVEQIQQPRLATPRLILEAFTTKDVPDIFKYASDPRVAQFVFWDHHSTLEDSQKYFNWILETTSTVRGRLYFNFAIRKKETGRAIGAIDFRNVAPHCGQIDYALDAAYWGQGLVTEAATALRDWALATLPEVVRLQAFCVEENRGSSRVMEKIGMQREGLRRKLFQVKGRFVNIVDYALIR